MSKIFLFFISIFLFFSCNDDSNKNSEATKTDIIQETVDSIDFESNENLNKIIPPESFQRIFYELTSPVELTEFVLYSNSNFNPDLLNSTNNSGRYSTNLKHALNMGVYGTDLIYCRMYEQKQDAIKYLSIIKTFTQELGIPKDDINKTLGNAENCMEKRDSLYGLIRKAFNDADKYLNSNDRNNMASLIYFGAWTEALHIATNIYKETDSNKKVIGLHIAQQKFALNNLLKLLSKTYQSPDISHYIVLIKKLKKIYDKIDIVVDEQQTKIDTINKIIIIDDDKTIVTPEQIKKITLTVRRIRADIIG